MLARRPVVCLTVLYLMSVAAPADARLFYVNPAGSDLRSGRSPAAAWRTVDRVNRAALRPGDMVEFRAGGIFSDSQLMPRRSGTSGAPIRFSSYGGGRATLARGVWFASIAWIEIDGLRIRGVADGIASGYGSGARHVTILDNVISDVGIAVNSTNPSDDAWTISGNRIAGTRDSGLVVQGDSADISGNQITNTGTDLAIPYDRHGIYSKSPHARIVGNRIVGFQAQGISTRFRDAIVSGNFIEGGDAGVGYWQQDRRAGTTVICGNTIARVRYGVLVGPERGPTRERFRIFDNHIDTSGGPAVYVPSGHPLLYKSRNVVTASDDHAAQSRAGAEPCQRSQSTQSQATSSRVGTSGWVRKVLYGIVLVVIAGAGVAKALRAHRANRLTQAG
jgi:hypothetical protein